jgi:hypothetical protein
MQIGLRTSGGPAICSSVNPSGSVKVWPLSLNSADLDVMVVNVSRVHARTVESRMNRWVMVSSPAEQGEEMFQAGGR